MSNQYKFKQEAIDYFTNQFSKKSVESESAWIIKVNGKRVKMHSGKSQWNTKGQAKSALVVSLGGKYHFSRKIFKIMESREPNFQTDGKWQDETYKEFMAEMEALGILQFIELKNEN